MHRPMHRPIRPLRSVLALSLLGLPAAAQVVNPAEDARSRAGARPQEEAEAPLPTTEVVARPLGRYAEEERVGPYGQPVWTTKRLFPSTRIYVRPAGSVEVEYWTRVKVPREGPSTVETQYELEFGLPGRFQVDLYAVTEKSGSEEELNLSEQKFEVRYALADWGELWMNPTLYLEYVQRDSRADKIEYKLLLGDELAPGWHFGSNLVLEHELSDSLENEWELTLGLSRVVIDEKLSVGMEMKASAVDVHGDRGDYTTGLEIGPSIRWRPLERVHVDLAPLIGIGGDSRAADLFLVIGLDL